MSPEEEFNLLIDAVMLAVENNLVEDGTVTLKALTNWCARVENSGGCVPDWEQAPHWAEWFAVDNEGIGYYYENKPTLGENMWEPVDIDRGQFIGNVYYFYENWRKALVKRPHDK